MTNKNYEFCGGTGGELGNDPWFGWRIANSCVDLYITENGGQLGPVRFYNDTDSPVQPYYINPWINENLNLDGVLGPLRGDFFCMPFGGNSEAWQDEKHPGHGEVAGGAWRMREASSANGELNICLEMNTNVRKGKIIKQITLVDGQNVIYSRHQIVGISGSMPLGHHAILAIPEKPGSTLVSVGEFDLGMTNPGWFSRPENGAAQALALGATFDNLTRVPTLDGGVTDCSTFPARPGFDDLLCVMKRDRGVPAWITAVFPDQGYLWFGLKDASVLPATLFWMSNRGRQAPPWNGRNHCLGIEDVCAFFADGIKASCEHNQLNEKGFKTAVELSPVKPVKIAYIQGVARIPEGFGRVAELIFEEDQLIFVSKEGLRASTKVNIGFLNPDFI